MKQLYKVYLASKSPRRKEILKLMGIDFTVCDSNADENIPERNPGLLVEALSKRKAENCSINEECIVIGADTVVSYDNMILGKPKDKEDAKRMLRLLSGQVSSVYTGVTLRFIGNNKPSVTFHTKSDVMFDILSEREIDEYVASGEPMDKAGAYGIQGTFAKHIKGINGDFYNVMGLPMNDLYKKMKEENVIFI